MRAVIYARFSSSNQREESIEGQFRECRAYALKKGYTVIGEYADRAMTGTNDRRPEFQKMIHDAEKKAFDVLICWKHDRFSRNRYDAAIYRKKLSSNGVKIEYVMEPVSDGADGIIVDAIMEGFAEFYSANLSENVKRGLYDSALKRLAIGQHCYGLTKGADGKFAHHPDQAPIVKRIFEEYATGKSSVDIIRDLNAEGYRTRYGGKFTKCSVGQIISNPKYKGLYQYADIYDENGIPPIVSVELWDACQELKKLNADKPNLKKDEGGYILAGKLYCGKCGGLMTSFSGTSCNGKEYKYYACKNQKNKRCDKKKVDKEYIEKAVTDMLIEIVHSDEVIEAYADYFVKWQEKKTEESSIPSLEKRLLDIDKEIKNLVSVIKGGTVIQSIVDEIKKLEEEKEGVKEAIAKEKLEQVILTRDDVVGFLRSFRQGDVDDLHWRIYLVETFLKAAYLFDDGRLILEMNFTGDKSNFGINLLEESDSDFFSSDFAALTLPTTAKSNYFVYFYDGSILAVKR